MPISFTVNGTRRQVDAPGDTPLLYVLRNDLEIGSPQFGCGLSQCGACSVLVDGTLVCACLVLAASVMGAAITTIEGISPDGVLTDVQKAFVDCGAVQCGFCTPGLVIAVQHLLEQNPAPTELELKEALSGNICRCTGYGRIFAAVDAVVELRSAR